MNSPHVLHNIKKSLVEDTTVNVLIFQTFFSRSFQLSFGYQGWN